MNFWPPYPGSTPITSTPSHDPSQGSRASTGVFGLIARWARLPSEVIVASVARGSARASM